MKMKAGLLVVLVMLLCPLNARAGDSGDKGEGSKVKLVTVIGHKWIRIFSNPGTDVYVMLKRPIHADDGIRSMWYLYNLKEPIALTSGKTYSSSLVQMFFDCKNKKRKARPVYASERKYLRGDQMSLASEIDKWKPAVPGTQGGYMLHLACDTY